MITDARSKNIIPFMYVVVTNVIAANGNAQQTLGLAADSEFELHYILGTCTEDVDTDFMPNNFSCQITDQSTGRNLSNLRVPARNLCGPSNGSIFMRRPVIFPAQANLLFDFLNLTGNNNTITLTLVGYKIFLS